MENLTNVTTGTVRLSYVHLFKPYAHMQGQEEKFSCTILVPKSDTETMARINAAIEAAKQKGIAEKWNGQCPPIVQMCIRDSSEVVSTSFCPNDSTTFNCSLPSRVSMLIPGSDAEIHRTPYSSRTSCTL